MTPAIPSSFKIWPAWILSAGLHGLIGLSLGDFSEPPSNISPTTVNMIWASAFESASTTQQKPKTSPQNTKKVCKDSLKKASRNNGSALLTPNHAPSGSLTPAAHNPYPIYPESAKEERREGQVVLIVTVSSQGYVSQVKARDSGAHPDFVKSAIDAVRRWRFHVHEIQGKEIILEIPIEFRLDQIENV